jgi:hypothetical protein
MAKLRKGDSIHIVPDDKAGTFSASFIFKNEYIEMLEKALKNGNDIFIQIPGDATIDRLFEFEKKTRIEIKA